MAAVLRSGSDIFGDEAGTLVILLFCWDSKRNTLQIVIYIICWRKVFLTCSKELMCLTFLVGKNVALVASLQKVDNLKVGI